MTSRVRDARGRWVKGADPLAGRDIVVRSMNRGEVMVHEAGRRPLFVFMPGSPAQLTRLISRYLEDGS